MYNQLKERNTSRNQLEVDIKQSTVCSLFYSGFFLGLFFHTQDGGDIFLRNIDWLSTDYTALYPKRHNSS
jgi:hypothetical protein